MSEERRKRSRVSLEFPLTIAFEDKRVRGTVHDLSLKGLACSTEEWILPGKECEVTLELESGLRMHMHGRIIRAGQDGAIDFIRMDEASFAHLRNLVRLYADDADLVDQELRHPAFKPEDGPFPE